jgi:hypothetical protein
MDQSDEDETAPVTNVDAEIKELLGLFDVPAFARRGQELEWALARLHARCLRARDERLDMVRVRLRQWAGAVDGPEAWSEVFAAPMDALWSLAGAEPPAWSERRAAPRRLRGIARDLVASLVRFNDRWERFLDDLRLDPINRMIDQYNRYYLLEKECSLGSARLAARHFTPRPRLTREVLLADHPFLPVPEFKT